MTPGELAESLIAQFGIVDARDIDLEAIAMDAGVAIEYQQLVGCEATLAGFEDKAVATIRPSSVRGRERFSIGHELGHWAMHRGRSFRCRVDEPDDNLGPAKSLERAADQYASHLLMPGPIFNPAVKEFGRPGFRDIEALADNFTTSIIATCLRMANINILPVIFACYSPQKRLLWHVRATDVPARWYLLNSLSEDSLAYDLMTKGQQTTTPRKQSADAWFENDDADNYEMMEHSAPYRQGCILVVLYLNTNMLFARFDPSVGGRRYTAQGSYVPPRSIR